MNVEIKLKRKRRLDTFSSVIRPKNSGVIWKKKGSSNTSNVGLSAVSVSNLNKNVKRYSRKDFLAYEAFEVIISFIKKTQVNLQLQVQRVRTDNGMEFKNKTLAKFFDEDVGKLKAKGDIGVFVGYSKESAAFRIYNKRTLSQVNEASKKDLEDLFQDFYDEYFDSSKIMKSSTTNVETLINKKVFHEVSESFQRESSSSSLNDVVQQNPEEVILPSSNTQSIPINMIPNGDEASTSHNVFNER
nr:integrase, catalytic region, zinc finger, CCHC-type, peptidase aspartic, catalytic [Tanacetum cinerariifolium]